MALLPLFGRTPSCGYHALSEEVKKQHPIDIVLVPDHPVEPRMIVEFQGYRDDELPRRMVSEAGLYCEKQQYDGPLILVAVFTSASFAKDLQPLKWGVEGGLIVEFMPQRIILEPEMEDTLRKTGRVELLVLLPLCMATEEQLRSKAPVWSQEIEASPLEAAQREKLMALMGAFIIHRLKRIELQELRHLLGGFAMENTQVGRELIDMGRKEGQREGLASARNNILKVLVRRFHRAPAPIHELVHGIEDLDKASDTLFLALDAESLEAFEEAFKGTVGR